MKLWGDQNNRSKERTEEIAKFLRTIEFYNLLDLACGDGQVIIDLSQEFRDVDFLGVDIEGNSNWTGTSNLKFWNMDIVDFLEKRRYIGKDFTVCIMLDTYRNWPKENEDIRDKLHKWLKSNVKYFITSVGLGANALPWEYKTIGKDGEYPLVVCRVE